MTNRLAVFFLLAGGLGLFSLEESFELLGCQLPISWKMSIQGAADLNGHVDDLCTVSIRVPAWLGHSAEGGKRNVPLKSLMTSSVDLTILQGLLE